MLVSVEHHALRPNLLILSMLAGICLCGSQFEEQHTSDFEALCMISGCIELIIQE